MELPFMASETIIVEMVKHGANRQVWWTVCMHYTLNLSYRSLYPIGNNYPQFGTCMVMHKVTVCTLDAIKLLQFVLVAYQLIIEQLEGGMHNMQYTQYMHVYAIYMHTDCNAITVCTFYAS